MIFYADMLNDEHNAIDKGGVGMATEAIIKVKEAEEQAKKIINNARDDARQILQEAEQLAEESYRKIITAAETEAKKLYDQAIAEGERTAQPILEKGKKEATSIRDFEENQLNRVVENIVERIVNTNGNR